MKYTEQAVETLDDAGSVIANKNIEIEQLRQRVAELEKGRDGLLAELERSLESFEYIAKYGNSCGHSQLRIPDLKAAIASVKGQP